ncbi:hypothetical protein [Heyndrickxia acidicola]|uniref:Uncharacterized protein n=1 Tax=Heyndrickxia acidicola TaxID=209389 RepID=A0ABU6MF27_9BACI|nr:hypothetical protein [Heyndrickxia acidicola]MED1201872.1 hypothetical protein [Heyndrickxia acidicola]
MTEENKEKIIEEALSLREQKEYEASNELFSKKHFHFMRTSFDTIW